MLVSSSTVHMSYCTLLLFLLTIPSISCDVNPITIYGNYSINNASTPLQAVSQVMSVPASAQVALTCNYTGGMATEWTAERPITVTGNNTIRIESFTEELNSSTYVCSSADGAYRSKVLLTSINPKIVPFLGEYSALLNELTQLDICVSFYPTSEYFIGIVWSHVQSGVTYCSSNYTSPGCYGCTVTLSAGNAGLYNVTASLYTNSTASSAADDYTLLHTILLTTPNLTNSLPESTHSFECDSLTLQCSATGNPISKINWYFTPLNSTQAQLITANNSISIHRSTSNAEMNTSTLIISRLNSSDAGTYVCSFTGVQNTMINSSTLLTVQPRLCLAYIRNTTTYHLRHNPLLVLDFQQTYSLFCTGYSRANWYKIYSTTPVSYNASLSVSQSLAGQTGSYLSISPSPLSGPGDIYICRTGSNDTMLSNSVYLTHDNLSFALDVSDVLYLSLGDAMTISAYVSTMIREYTIDWMFTPLSSRMTSSITSANWTVSSSADTIQLSAVTNNSYGSIVASYTLDGVTSNVTVIIARLVAPQLILKPSFISPLEIWETSSLEVVCSLRNMTQLISGPTWSNINLEGDANGVSISNNDTLVINNITSLNYNYSCMAENKLGADSVTLNIVVHPLSYQLMQLLVESPSSSYTLANITNVVNIIMNATQLLGNHSSVGTVEVNCSVTDWYNSHYLNYSTVQWMFREISHNASLLPLTQATAPTYIRILTANLILLNMSQYYLDTNEILYSAELVCYTSIGNVNISKSANINIIPPSPTTTTTLAVTNTTQYSPHPPEASHIVILFIVPNCSFFGYSSLLAIKNILLDSANSNCSCTYPNSSLHFTHHFCHKLGPKDLNHFLLTLCAAGPLALLTTLQSIGVRDYMLYNISDNVTSIKIELHRVLDDYDSNHCMGYAPTTTVTPTIPASAQPVSVVMIVVLIFSFAVIAAILTFCCCFAVILIAKLFYKYPLAFNRNKTPSSPLMYAQQTLTLSQDTGLAEMSPSRLPATFKTASGSADLSSINQELESRPFPRSDPAASATPMYTNPVALEYTSSYAAATSFGYAPMDTNNNNNNNDDDDDLDHTFSDDNIAPPLL